MQKEDLRIVYMGTPDFAVESLRQLVEGGYNVIGVITMPDKPMGRHGSVLQPSPVKQYAVEKGLRVLQPVNLKDEAFVEELRSLKADLQIVVAFRMLPEVVWNMPPMGTFNLHASLLPQYRGAAPINWAIINGDTEAGKAEVVLLSTDGEGATIHANGDATLLVLTGEPIDEPIFGHGPFVMNTEKEIRQAIDDFNKGQFIHPPAA